MDAEGNCWQCDVEATDFLEACQAGTFLANELRENLNAGTRKRGLYDATEKGHLEVVRRFLDLDPSIKVTYSIAWAAVLGGLPVYRFLHARYPDMIHWSFEGGGCAVHQACKVGNMEVLKYLLENGADPGRTPKLECTVPWINSPMDATFWNDDEEALRLLVQYGATFKSSEALKDAAQFGRLKAAECLLDMGFDVNYISAFGNHDLNTRRQQCTAPLHPAAGTGDRYMVQLLPANGADPWLRDRVGKLHLTWLMKKDFCEFSSSSRVEDCRSHGTHHCSRKLSPADSKIAIILMQAPSSSRALFQSIRPLFSYSLTADHDDALGFDFMNSKLSCSLDNSPVGIQHYNPTHWRAR